MCSVKPRNASACSLPALTMPPIRQGNSVEYLREHAELGPADLAEADQVVAVLVQELWRGVGERRDVGEQRVELGLAVLERVGRR